MLVYSKQTGDDLVIVVVNVDPHAPRTTMVHLEHARARAGLGGHASP